MAHSEGLLGASRSPSSSGCAPTDGSDDDTGARWRQRVQRAKYYIPSISWMSQYTVSDLGGDVVAGLTVSSVLIPQSISYAASLGRLSPVAGLFSGCFPSIIYAFLGTSRQLNVGPTAAVSLLVGQALTDIRQSLPPDADWEKEQHGIGIAVATIITLQAGVIASALGLLRLGFIDVVLSKAVLRGFISALGAVIIIEQLPALLGLWATERVVRPGTNYEKIEFLWNHAFTSYHAQTTIIGFSTLASLVVLRRLKVVGARRFRWIRQVPEILAVVIVSTYLSWRYSWAERHDVATLGAVEVPAPSLDFFQHPMQRENIKYLRTTTSYALLICFVGFLDSIAAAKQSASRFRHSISPNRELVALGVANLAISCIPGTITAFGSTSRTRVNGDAGGKTQFSSLVSAAVVLLVTFFMTPLLYHLPKCVLASIMCLVACNLLEDTPKDLAFYIRLESYMDVVLLSLTFLFSVIWRIQEGIMVSIVLSLLLVIRKSSKPRISVMGHSRTSDRWEAVEDADSDVEEEPTSGILVVRIRENLHFANSAQLRERLRRIELFGAKHRQRHPSDARGRLHTEVIVFDMIAMNNLDASAVQILDEIIHEYTRQSVRIYLANLNHKPFKKLSRGGALERLGGEYVVSSVEEAMRAVGHHSGFSS
ncbi:sulfate transporter family-domain-containing protein [Pterulicium gracile]|uniref:Sulfate transporter family-domain-containing protein n=1 Tax=Pterulicium gracile TaxID=1884261 RepID=A0A5C3QLP5_9AGAR|nr:sulfate transporter family-domain-containing protein [Pterula gracilis]